MFNENCVEVNRKYFVVAIGDDSPGNASILSRHSRLQILSNKMSFLYVKFKENDVMFHCSIRYLMPDFSSSSSSSSFFFSFCSSFYSFSSSSPSLASSPPSPLLLLLLLLILLLLLLLLLFLLLLLLLVATA